MSQQEETGRTEGREPPPAGANCQPSTATRQPVTVIMLGCGKADHTARALASLAETRHPALQLVFVDNGSADHTPAVVQDFARAVQGKGWKTDYARFEANQGAVAGRNAALERAEGEFIAFLDNDIALARRSWLQALLARFATEPDLGILGPKILYAHQPHDIQCAGCDVYQSGRVSFRGRGEPSGWPEAALPRDAPCLISAAWLMRRAVWEDLGPLDMAFHPVQFEDIDYCFRARQAGWRVAYEPSVAVYHHENVTTAGGGGGEGAYLRLTQANGLKFKRKWAETIRAVGLPDSLAPPWRNLPRVPTGAAAVPPMED